MKPKEPKTKRTYSVPEINQLLLTEAFERDLTLFAKLVREEGGIFGEPVVNRNWTLTVVKEPDGRRSLHINVPTKKR